MNPSALTPEMRATIARSAAAVASETRVLALLDAEVEQTLAEQPMLPRTETMRRTLWALLFTNLMGAVPIPVPVSETERTKAA